MVVIPIAVHPNDFLFYLFIVKHLPNHQNDKTLMFLFDKKGNFIWKAYFVFDFRVKLEPSVEVLFEQYFQILFILKYLYSMV